MDETKQIVKQSADAQVCQSQPLNSEPIVVRPVLASNVQLVGPMLDSGFAQQQWLVLRNGSFIQVSELLYRVAELANGQRSLEQIAEAMTETTEWMVEADHVRQLVEKLIPLGIITSVADDQVASPDLALNQPAAATLGFNIRAKVIGPQIIDPIAKALAIFYSTPVMLALLSIIVTAHLWFYFIHGVYATTLDLLYRPWAVPVILMIMILAGVFHELGHAAALRYGGGQVRGMGVGIYLVYPAFYTDVTDSYRLNRWARVRTDLGGFYFYLIFTLGVFALYFLTGHEFLLFIVLLINLDILYQLLPFVRMDGYWALADLTGIPDFLSMMGPFVASVLPLRSWQGSRLPTLKPWVKVVFAAYLLLVLPLLLFTLMFMVLRLPRLLVTFWDSTFYQARVFGQAYSNGDVPGMIIVALSTLFLSVTIIGTGYIFLRLGRTSTRALWNWSLPTPKRRIVGAGVALGAIALITYFWMPYIYFFTHNPPTGVQSYTVTSRNHVEGSVAYTQEPPVGGDHAPLWQNCGFYDTPIAPENAVHSMEHGAVWVTYRPDLQAEDIAALRQLAYRQIYVLVSPLPDQTMPVVAAAWGKQLPLASVDDPKLDQFVRTYRLSNEAPESGKECIGGIGSPK
jgi:putative peptide zinc metalloprotease protein